MLRWQRTLMIDWHIYFMVKEQKAGWPAKVLDGGSL